MAAEPGYRGPPQNPDAERVVLAAVLKRPQTLDGLDSLRSDHFSHPGHVVLFKTISERYGRGDAVTPVTLAPLVDGTPELRGVGGGRYVHDIAAQATSLREANDAAGQIIEMATRRQLMQVGATLVSRANDMRDGTADGLLTDAEIRLQQIAEADQPGAGLLPIADYVREAIEDTEAALAGEARFMSTGLTALDRALGGLFRSDLIIAGARPSMGKTVLSMGIAEHAAHTEPVAFFSLEMNGRQLAARQMARHAGISASRMRRGAVSDEDMAHHIRPSADRFADLPLYIDETPSLSVGQIRNRARRLARRGGLGLVVIDYLQLIHAPEARNSTRTEDLSKVTRALKGLAKELNVPVLVLSQLSRRCEQREDKRPILSDLRESGAIEQDADTVLFLYREHVYRVAAAPVRDGYKSEDAFDSAYADWEAGCKTCERKAEVIVSKQRNGPAGLTVDLGFNPTLTVFEDMP